MLAVPPHVDLEREEPGPSRARCHQPFSISRRDSAAVSRFQELNEEEAQAIFLQVFQAAGHAVRDGTITWTATSQFTGHEGEVLAVPSRSISGLRTKIRPNDAGAGYRRHCASFTEDEITGLAQAPPAMPAQWPVGDDGLSPAHTRKRPTTTCLLGIPSRLVDRLEKNPPGALIAGKDCWWQAAGSYPQSLAGERFVEMAELPGRVSDTLLEALAT